MPKVSIVLPTYNGEKFIKESIESVINQTFTDWELIIVNDCSTDGTQEIIEYFLKIDKRIKCIKNLENKKLPNSLNVGFRVAKGELLTWTSDDNVFLPNALQEMVSFLESNLNSYMVCAKMQIIDETGRFIRMHSEYNEFDMLYNDCVGACFMYKRCVITDVGEYDPNRFLVEDYEYWLRILLHYGKIDSINKTLYKYREHSKSLTGKRKKDIYEQLLRLKKDYVVDIINKYYYKKDVICNTYYELKFRNMVNEDIEDKCKQICPEIKDELEIDNKKDIIIYGAGEYGNKAYQKYKDKIVFYVDINQNKIGKHFNNVGIISMDYLTKYLSKNKTNVLIASQPRNIHSFISTLNKYGINKYSVFYC